MSTMRKIARQMAKTQMQEDGIQHPCRQYNRPGVVALGHTTSGEKTSYFASHWRAAAAKRMERLSIKAPKKSSRKRGIFTRKTYGQA